MKIQSFDISKQVLIIAEIGNNHEGNFNLAKDMIKMAADSGADAVKFQTFCADRYVSQLDKKRYDQLKSYELTYEQFELLSQTAIKNGLIFLSTPFDIESVDALEPYVPAYKISSGDNTFWPLIKHIAKKGKPVILSTGLTTMNELKNAVAIISENSPIKKSREKLALLHCISAYPADLSDLNLLSIQYLKDNFDVLTGYSDHAMGIYSCLTAVGVGARIIEKHFTYSKEGQTFKDHLLSATPDEFKKMVTRIRDIEKMIGIYQKKPAKSESPLFSAARRSIAARKNISKGEILDISHITWIRPGNGLKPGNEDLLIGRKLKNVVLCGAIFTEDDFEKK